MQVAELQQLRKPPGELGGVGRTAYDAARGKAAAAARGYFGDDFAHCFCGHGPSPGPLINRGQYVRVAAVGSICEQFLEATRDCDAQIVSIGAGFDTRYWQLAANGALYVELDQPLIVGRKCAIVAAEPALLAALPEGGSAVGAEAICSARYALRAADVREPEQLGAALAAAGWVPARPTLVLLECVLVYLPPEAASAVLGWFAQRCARVVLAGYEQIRPDDAFGRTMVENLRRRDCPLLGLAACPDAAAQEARCRGAGYGRAEALDLLSYHDSVLAAEERARVGSLEPLDELEEWALLMQHYAALLAVRDRGAEGGGGGEGGGGEGGGGEGGDGGASQLFATLSLRAPVTRPFPVGSAPLARGRGPGGPGLARGVARPVSPPL